MHYVKSLCTHGPQSDDVGNEIEESHPESGRDERRRDKYHGSAANIQLVLAGYSYGSLIASHLPTPASILRQFQRASEGTIEAEISLRAVTLAAKWNQDAELHRQARASDAHKLRPTGRVLAVSIGGNEKGSRRASHEGKRSFESIRRSVDRSRQKLGLRLYSQSSDVSASVDEKHLDWPEMPTVQTSYLLISPLLPPISTLAMMSLHPSSRATGCEEKFLSNPTLVIYGDSDFFTSHGKLRRWVEDLQDKSRSLFKFSEIPNAGHFWREEGSERNLKSSIQTWTKDVLRDDTSNG